MSTITPTIGRKVWYYGADAYGNIHDTRVPFDATVVYVWSPDLVNLLCVDHTGRTFVRTSVRLRDPGPNDTHGIEGEFATWMPYQVGQARKEG